MSNERFRLATIGTGNIARAHRRAMSELWSKGLDDFVVTAVCDVNQEAVQFAAQDVEERFGIRPAVYTDYRELLSQEEIDGADLCLPAGLHHPVAIDCMDAGVPVLSEKPLGITTKAALKMAETAERTGCVLATAHQSRRSPSQRAVHWVLNRSKLIGEPVTFLHQHAAPRWHPPADQPRGPAGDLPSLVPPWQRETREESPVQRRLMSGGGPVLSCGAHYFDTMRYLLGDLEKVYAEVRELGTGSPKCLDESVENAVFAVLTFKNGVVGTWSYWLDASGESFTNVMFYGSQGSLRDSSQGRYRCWCHLFSADARVGALDSGRLTQGDGTQLSLDELKRMHLEALSKEEKEALYPHGVTNPMAVEIWDFVETVRGNRKRVEVDGWDGLKAVAACDALYESAWTGEAILLDDILSGKRGAYQAPIDEHWGL